MGGRYGEIRGDRGRSCDLAREVEGGEERCEGGVGGKLEGGVGRDGEIARDCARSREIARDFE